MPRISSKTVDAVIEMTDIVSLAENYTRLERRGSNWWGCCPFHNEKTPSFSVVPDKRMFYCFGCHKGGGTINFLMEIENIVFKKADERLAKRRRLLCCGKTGYRKARNNGAVRKGCRQLSLSFNRIACRRKCPHLHQRARRFRRYYRNV